MTCLSGKIVKSFACLLFVGILNPLPASASSFQNSCKRISIHGAKLVATCLRVNGEPKRTSIMLKGIENINGQFRYTRRGRPANFHHSCDDIYVVGTTLKANCRRIDGRYRETSIQIRGISNIDGRLRY